MEGVAAFIAAHGYPAIAIIVGLESMGLPLPGETTLITAAIFAGSTHVLELGPVIAAAAAGAIAGDTAGFWIGRTAGQALVVRYGSHLRMTPARLAIGQHLFERHGAKVVFLGRFIAILRTITALLAGINGMAWRRFLVFNAAGGFAWAALMGVGAYLLGHRMERMTGVVGVVGLAGAIAAVVIAFAIGRGYERRWINRARS
ncbi:MAG TPA: DedA family protein [Vicinamibacterales bacterium]|nr:DedA family protein [Vicinamibacterales bacterium]